MSTNSGLQSKHAVYIVDDDPSVRRLIARFVTNEGWSAIEFANGDSMMEVLDSAPPALMLLDINMPGRSGLQCLQEIRKKHSKINLPVLIVSSITEGREVAECLSAGANDYVTKPIERVVFQARMRLQIELFERELLAVKQRRALVNASFLQTATNNVMPDPMAVLTLGGEVVQCNEALINACADTGPANWAELCRTLFGGALIGQNGYDPEQVKVLAEPDFDAECTISSRGKTLYYTALHRKVGHVIGGEGVVLRVWRDVTAMRERSQQAAQLAKLEAMELFAAGVAHNFNNILGSIASAAELIAKIGGSDARCTRCVGAIKSAVTHGSRLTGKMVRALKDTPGVMVSDSFGALVQQSISIQRELHGARIEFKTLIQPRLKAVCVDSGSLQEILHTLIQNATDAISDKGEISVSAREGDSGDHLELVIADTGCGISPAVMGKIFEPFYSTKSMDDRNGVSVSGRGLGLWGIYSLLKSYGGSIECYSELGKGSTFVVRIPHSRVVACPINLPVTAHIDDPN